MPHHAALCVQDPQDRPSAGELLKDPWLVSSTKTLKMSWNKTAGLVRRGLKKPSDAHKTLASVMQRMVDDSGAQPSQAGAQPSQAGAPTLGSTHLASDLTAPDPSARKTLQEFPSRSFRERKDTGHIATDPAEAATAGTPPQKGWDDTAMRGSNPIEEPAEQQVRHELLGLVFRTWRFISSAASAWP